MNLFIPVKQDKGIFNVFAKIDVSFISETDVLGGKRADDGCIGEGVDLIGEDVDLIGESMDLISEGVDLNIGEGVDLSIGGIGFDEGADCSSSCIDADD